MRKNGFYKDCPTCGKSFHVKPYQIRKGWGKYCSWGCRHRTPEQRQQQKERAKTIDWSKRKPLPHAYKKGHAPWNKGLKGCFNEETLDKIRAYRASQTFLKANTDIEMAMKEALDKKSIKYVQQHNVDNKFLIDFALLKDKIAIECDGEYWHRLPRNRHIDFLKERYLRSKGWRVVRFTDKLINGNIDYCVNVISMMLNSPLFKGMEVVF